MEPRRRTQDPLFSSCLDTLIRCPLKKKWALHDTLYLSSSGDIRTYMDAPVLPSSQSMMKRGKFAVVHSAYLCSITLLALMEICWLAPRSLTRTFRVLRT